MKHLCAWVIAALGSLASFVVAPLFAQSSVIDIGTLGPNPYQSSALWAVNDRNQAVGWCEIGGSDTDRAILWDDGQLIDLGVLPGDTASSARAINGRGQVVGISVDHNLARAHAFRWQDGAMVDLTQPGANSCYAFDINNRGVVVGRIFADSGIIHGAIWPKALTRIPVDGVVR